MKCSVECCDRAAVTRSWCDKHYRRNKKYGDPLLHGSKKVDQGDEIARFNAKHARGSDDDCWLWKGGTRANGKGMLYGRHWLDNGRVVGAHRFSFELATGVRVGDRFVCHKCDNPLCVNPKHLFLSDHAGNMRDMVQKNRSHRGNGEAANHSKLTNAQAVEIRNSKLSERQLGVKYGISAGAAGNIRRGRGYPDAQT